MKLTHVRIHRFGIWSDFDLPLASRGPTVLYGPNETGKTTLLRFLRGVLYGFGAERDGGETVAELRDGSVSYESAESHGTIRRVHVPGSAERLSVTGLEGENDPAGALQRLVCGTDAALFRQVFAVGLPDMQELGTLQGEAVARHLYGASLGLEGRRLLAAADDLAERRSRLFDPATESGRVPDLRRRLADCEERLRAFGDVRDRHAALEAEREGLESAIAESRRTQSQVQSDLRGFLFLERAWPAWKEVRDLQAELDALPEHPGVDAGVRQKLLELDAESASAGKCRAAILAEADALRSRRRSLRESAPGSRASRGLRTWVSRREGIAELLDRARRMDGSCAELDRELAACTKELGSAWTAARLERAADSSDGRARLEERARKLAESTARRTALRRRLRRASLRSHRTLQEIRDVVASLGCESLDEALGLARRRLEGLDDLRRLRLRIAELEQRRIGLEEQRSRWEARLRLPPWVYVVLAVFGAAGLVFVVAGLVTGLTTSGLAGAVYALLGLTCGGMAWSLKAHFEGETRDAVDRLDDLIRENEVRLREVRTALSRREAETRADDEAWSPPEGESALVAEGDGAAQAPIEEQRLLAGTRLLVELERLAARRDRTLARRKRLVEQRRAFRTVQQEFSAARNAWGELVVSLGLTETLSAEAALREWDRVQQARDVQRRRNELETDRQAVARRLRGTVRRLSAAAEKHTPELLRTCDVERDPLGLIDAWRMRLRESTSGRRDALRLRRDERLRRREAVRYRAQLEELDRRRSELFARCGVGTREAFERELERTERRRELEECLSIAQEDLDSAVRTEPDLAIVEDDLLGFDPEENGTRILESQRTLERLERTVLEDHERLGRTKQALAALVADDRPARRLAERETLVAQLREAEEELLALEAAAEAVERLGREQERDCQPAVLEDAGRWLARLTRGRYRRTWTPLGRRRILVDDAAGATCGTEELSGGTREQVYLALRIALVRHLAGQGIELPLVLDDVTVNFDRQRTEAAVDTLRAVADEGQQVLVLTCHEHVAELFARQGIEPVRLPDREANREQRLAG